MRRVVFAWLLFGAALACRANAASLELGGEVIPLEVTHCRAEAYRSGQLEIRAEITAAGSLRGRPAMLFLAKVAGAAADHFDLYLIDPPRELREMPPLEAQNRILTGRADLHRKRLAELHAEMDPAATEGLSNEEMMTRVEEQVARIEALEESMAAGQPPQLRSFGAATVDGETIRFTGSDTRAIAGAEAFTGLGGEVRLTARCGQ